MSVRTRSISSKRVDDVLQKIKILPHSIEAEQAVLGGVMLDNNAWDRIVDVVCEEDFYKSEHRLIFQTLSALRAKNQPFDAITLISEMSRSNELANVGGDAYIFSLANNTPSVANIRAYAEIVRERSIFRQLIESCNIIADSAFNPPIGETCDKILNKAESEIFKIAEQKVRGAGPIEISKLLHGAASKIKALSESGEKITGVATGFFDLDDLTSGLQKGDLIIVAGRPSMGKTAFALNIAEYATIKSNEAALVFSLEMPAESIVMRMVSSLGRIDQRKLRTGKFSDADLPRVTSAFSLLKDIPLYIDDTSSLSPAEILARSRRVSRLLKGKLGLIVIDYLQLMQIPGFRDGRVQEITEITRALKGMAKELNVPILALSQLNRSLEQRGDKRPVMSDLRESGAIEQDADLILFIYRDEVYNEDSSDKGAAEIIISKHRNGAIGRFKMTFLGQYTKFENFAPLNGMIETSKLQSNTQNSGNDNSVSDASSGKRKRKGKVDEMYTPS